MRRVEVYEAWTFDVWGNEDDGYSVNDRSCDDRGYPFLVDGAEDTWGAPSDAALRAALGLVDDVSISTDGDDRVITVDSDDERAPGRPEGELILQGTCGIPDDDAWLLVYELIGGPTPREPWRAVWSYDGGELEWQDFATEALARAVAEEGDVILALVDAQATRDTGRLAKGRPEEEPEPLYGEPCGECPSCGRGNEDYCHDLQRRGLLCV